MDARMRAEPFEVVVSPSGAARVEAALRFLAALPPGTEVRIVASSREAADELARERTRRTGASFGLYRETLRGLAARLSARALAADERAPIGRLGVLALAARAGADAHREGAMEYFAPIADCPSFPRALASTIDEVRALGISAPALRDEGAGDLAALLERYEALLATERVADRAAALEVAASEAERAPAMPLLLLDVAIGDAAEARLVEALVAKAPRALATVPEGDGRALAALSAMGASILNDAPGEASGSLSRLARHLFDPEAVPRGDADDEVRFFSAPGEGRECVEIARRIQTEARRGVPFDAIAVALRAPNTYAALLEGALRRAGIPACFATGAKRPHPSGRALVALLACRAEGLSAKRFAEYLSLGQVPDGSPDEALAREPAFEIGADELLGAPLRDREDDAREDEIDRERREEPGETHAPTAAGTLRAPGRWEQLLVDASVIGGEARWAARLDGLDEELALRQKAILRDDPGSARAEAIDRDRVRLAELRRFALPLVGALARLPASASWGRWLDLLARLAEASLRKPEAVLEALAELAPMRDVGPVGLDEVRETLAERLTTVVVAPPKHRHGRVLVCTPSELRGRAFDVVFVPGLAERVFPERPREDPLLLDARRARLPRDVRLALGLVTQADRADAERLLLRLAVGAARRRVHVSYPRLETGEEPRARVPSFYGLDVLRAVTGEVPDHAELQRAAAEEGQARLAWPAPPSELSAIDDAEHDLAVLGRLLRPGADAARATGRARYLLELNPHLARTLRARWARWRRTWSRYDGLVEPTADAQSVLAAHRLDRRAYSVSALQRFAACPYRFHLTAILGLSPREEPTAIERLDPATRGTLHHRALAALARALERRSMQLTPATLRECAALLDEAVDREARALRERLAPAVPRVFEDEVEGVRAELLVHLQKLAEESDAYEPVHAELAFGLDPEDGDDPASVRDPLRLFDRYALRGRIDAVERARASGELRVTDYKTGADETSGYLVLGGGEVLQPVLYGLAVEALTGRVVEAGRLSFGTAKGGFAERVVPLDDDARRRAKMALAAIDRAVETGFLPPLPKKDACARCDVRVVCGPDEERRTSRKEHDRLRDRSAVDALFTLRRSP
jgi:CRISPR/Cas system-associated exonuclease Cas4 (RecB family)